MAGFEKLTDFDKQLLDWMVEKDSGHSRECVLSAVNHLKMAYKIKDIDPEIALFRCITSEEEIARAIFLVLKKQGYKNIDKVKDKDHKYKQALDLFLIVIQNYFVSWAIAVEDFPKNIKLKLNNEKKILEIILDIKNIGSIIPIPPLNFSMTLNDKPYYFGKELQEIAKLNGKKILKQIEEKANLRNKIIYAEPNGGSHITSSIDDEIDRYYQRVFKLVRIYCLIYPHSEKFDFIQNAIDAFIFMMNDIEA